MDDKEKVKQVIEALELFQHEKIELEKNIRKSIDKFMCKWEPLKISIESIDIDNTRIIQNGDSENILSGLKLNLVFYNSKK